MLICLIKYLQLTLYRIVDFHPNILKFHGVTKGIFYYTEHFYTYKTMFERTLIIDQLNTYLLVIEWANDGALHEYLELHFENLKGDDKLRLAKEITKGVMCLHKKRIIHRDLVINIVYWKTFY